MAKWTFWKAAVGAGIGLFIVASGYVIGDTSHDVTYQSVGPAKVQDYITSDTHYYVRLQGDSTLYSLTRPDFSPSVPESVLNGPDVQFIYDPTSTTSIDIQSISGTRFSGHAYTVVAVTIGQSTSPDYQTADFKQHPQGYTVNLWSWADGIMAFGGLLTLLSLIVPAHIMIMITDALIGASVLPVLTLVYIGIAVPSQFSDFGEAILENIVLLVGAAMLGLVGGFCVGVYHAVAGAK